MARRRGMIGAGVAGALVAVLLGSQLIEGKNGVFKSSSPPPLLWQGAADRKPARFVAVEVLAVKPDKGGFLGIGESPSIVGAFPNATNMEVRRLDGARDRLVVRAPGAELPPGLAKGARVVLGLVDDAHVICIIVPPATLPPAEWETWAAGQRCG